MRVLRVILIISIILFVACEKKSRRTILNKQASEYIYPTTGDNNSSNDDIATAPIGEVIPDDPQNADLLQGIELPLMEGEEPQCGGGNEVEDPPNDEPIVATNVNFNCIYGDFGNNNITGSNADDAILGEAGNDTISGGDGNDVLMGAQGDDTYIIGTGEGTDIILNDADGTNTIICETNLLVKSVKSGDDRIIVGDGFFLVISGYYSGATRITNFHCPGLNI